MENDSRQAYVAPSDWFDEKALNLAKAREEIEALSTEIASMLAEIEDIFPRQNPRIESDWQVVIGVWENRLLEAQIAMRRAKRRCNLIQARINTGASVDLQEVEAQLDEELLTWVEQLGEAVDRYQQAVSSQQNAVHITTVEALEQKRLFRILAKRLHPDLHPNLSESARAMFELAQLAYRQSDLKILQSLEVSTAYLDSAAMLPNTLEAAEAQIEELESQIRSLEQRLEEIKQEPPYCLRAKLNDAMWVEAHVAQLKQEAEECRQAEGEWLRRCEEIVGDRG